VDAVVIGAENAHAGGRFLSWGQAVLSGYGGSGKPAEDGNSADTMQVSSVI
jgi:hypothetical protein